MVGKVFFIAGKAMFEWTCYKEIDNFPRCQFLGNRLCSNAVWLKYIIEQLYMIYFDIIIIQLLWLQRIYNSIERNVLCLGKYLIHQKSWTIHSTRCLHIHCVKRLENSVRSRETVLFCLQLWKSHDLRVGINWECVFSIDLISFIKFHLSS